MLPDRVSNPGPLTYESGALPIALRGPAASWYRNTGSQGVQGLTCCVHAQFDRKSTLKKRKKQIFLECVHAQ